MLAALLLLGVLPLAAMPLAEGEDDDDAVSDPKQAATSVQETPESLAAPSLPLLGSSTEGTVHAITGDPGQTALTEFTPGEDIVEVNLTSVTDEIVFDMATSSDTSWVSFGLSGESTTTIEFEGLAEIPFGDVILKMLDEETGEPFEQSLGDVFATSSQMDEIPANGPTPEGSGAPSMLERHGEEQTVTASKAIESSFNDADDGAAPPEEGTPQMDDAKTAPAQAAALETSEENISAGDSEAMISEAEASDAAEETLNSAALDDGFGEDTLIFDQVEDALESDEDGVFWLYNTGSDSADIAEIKDFEVGQDFLRVSLNGHHGDQDEPLIHVEPSADGRDGMVSVNGALVAILRGVPTATSDDIYADVQPDVFA